MSAFVSLTISLFHRVRQLFSLLELVKFLKLIIFSLSSSQTLQRASSVPTRSNVPDKFPQYSTPRHEQTQSQDQSQDLPGPISASTTEESVAPTSMEPLLSLTARGALQASNIKFELNGQQALPNLPNIIPLQGHLHQQGWL